MAEDESTSRTAVKTYVPAYQKGVWEEHAEELEMSQSEFVRTMVQAGRRHYSEDSPPEVETTTGDGADDSTTLANRIETLLATEGPLSWDELVVELTDDIETRLDDSLEELQAANVIKYSGRDGGYTLLES